MEYASCLPAPQCSAELPHQLDDEQHGLGPAAAHACPPCCGPHWPPSMMLAAGTHAGTCTSPVWMQSVSKHCIVVPSGRVKL